MRLSAIFIATIGLSGPALAIVDPSAPPTPCVPPRTPASPIPSLIAQGCQYATDITPEVCADYLAQQILLAQSQNCGNKTEAYTYCLGLPDNSPAACSSFDPSGGGGQDCSTSTLTTYSYCGNDQGWFAAGDPVSLVKCLFFQLGLCVPDDGVGHYDGNVFQGGVEDCPLEGYVPGCGVVIASSSSSAVETPTPTTTTVQASTTAPTSTAPPPVFPSGGPHFYLRLNGSGTYVAPLGFTTTDPTEAETFFLQNTELFTSDGLQVQASPGDMGENTVQDIVFAGFDGTLPIQMAFSLVTQGVDPLPPTRRAEGEKRQLVGLTVLYWVNELFAAPGTTARFCVLEELVYAVFQSPGDNPDFDTLCETVLLTADYVNSAPSSSTCDCTDSASTTDSSTTSAVSSIESIANSTGSMTATSRMMSTGSSTFATIINSQMTAGPNMTACPIGQTLVEFTTVRAL